VLSVIERL